MSIALRTLTVFVLAATALSGCAATTTPTTQSSTTELTGTVGAVDFDNGYLTLGSGPTIVDSYFDLMCPYCEQFETASGAHLADLVASGEITLRLHPMVFLDRLSMGTEYSTRATNALVAVAVTSPDAVLPYLRLLFENKPDENAVGLTDEVLAEFALEANASGIEQVQLDRTYVAWSAANTDRAMAEGGIVDADVTVVESVPLVLVNGHPYSGELTDGDEFARFLASN